MSYIVLSRKYRPRSFKEVLGQEHVTFTLLNAINSNKIGHAYLFSGSRGVGKTTVARILAKAINCMSSLDGEPCNECKLCQEITLGNCLDVVEIDGASNRGIDEVRRLREDVKSCSLKAKFKVYIIDEVHMLTEQAFNALLKTLEEPPHHVVFIFATTEPQKLPPTILSRCQRFGFKQITPQLIQDQLYNIIKREDILIEASAVEYISNVVDGSLRDAEVILDQLIAYSPGKKILLEDVLTLLGTRDKSELIKLLYLASCASQEAILYFNNLLSKGGDISTICRDLIELCKDMLLYKVIQQLDSNLPYAEEVFKKSKEYSLNELYRLFNSLCILNERIRRFPNQAKILFEVFLIRYNLLHASKETASKEVASKEVASKEIIEIKKELAKKEELILSNSEKLQDNIHKIFEEIKLKLKPKSQILYHGLLSCKVKEYKDNKLILETDNNLNFTKGIVDKNMSLIKESLGEYLGCDVEVELVHRDIEDKEKEDILLKKVLDILEGEVIKPNG